MGKVGEQVGACYWPLAACSWPPIDGRLLLATGSCPLALVACCWPPAIGRQLLADLGRLLLADWWPTQHVIKRRQMSINSQSSAKAITC